MALRGGGGRGGSARGDRGGGAEAEAAAAKQRLWRVALYPHCIPQRACDGGRWRMVGGGGGGGGPWQGRVAEAEVEGGGGRGRRRWRVAESGIITYQNIVRRGKT